MPELEIKKCCDVCVHFGGRQQRKWLCYLNGNELVICGQEGCSGFEANLDTINNITESQRAEFNREGRCREHVLNKELADRDIEIEELKKLVAKINELKSEIRKLKRKAQKNTKKKPLGPLESKYRMIHVKWIGKVGCTTAWRGIPPEVEPSVHYCYSVGWLVFRGTNSIMIVPHISPEHEERNVTEQGLGGMTIPLNSIIEITPLSDCQMKPLLDRSSKRST